MLLTVARTKVKRTVQTVVIKKCLITSNLNFLYKVQKPIFFFKNLELGEVLFFIIKLIEYVLYAFYLGFPPNLFRNSSICFLSLGSFITPKIPSFSIFF